MKNQTTSRFERLAEQAGVTIDGMGFGEGNVEAFAKLIVQECVDVMDKTAKDARENFTYMGDDVPTFVHQSQITKHFGM